MYFCYYSIVCMKILYAGLKHENYNPQRGTSFEYNNFYLFLTRLPGVRMVDCFFDEVAALGVKNYNEKLLRLVEQEQPALVLVFMYTDEVTKETLLQIKQRWPHIKTLAWCSDDHWRLDNYSRFYAPYFDWVVTTWSKAPERYVRYGITNVIRSQWACNPFVWHPVSGVQQDIDVSFIGQRNPGRAQIIKALRAAGIPVVVRGYGWPEGKISQEGMIEMFSRSKINLNFNVPTPLFYPKRLARLFLKASVGRIVPDWHLVSNIRSWRGMSIPQIKARPFEILGCRAFLISARADDMERYYEDKKEIVYFDRVQDLIEHLRYYLTHDKERERIVEAGYTRTMAEHTYQKRFGEIFQKIGISL